MMRDKAWHRYLAGMRLPDHAMCVAIDKDDNHITVPCSQLHDRIVIYRLVEEDEPSYTCPRCGMVSYHPKDIEHLYCAKCHEFE